MIVLSDNDILFKLAHCNLLDLLPACLGVSASEIGILPTCIHKLRRVLKGDAIVLGRIEAFCAQVTVLKDDDVDSDTLAMLLDTGADAGEAILAATICKTPESYLLTGDKRAIQALGKLPAGDVKDGITSKVICFEALVLGMLENYGFEQLQANFIDGAKCDSMLAMAFGPARSESHAVDCLTSYLDALRQTSAWALFPEKVSVLCSSSEQSARDAETSA